MSLQAKLALLDLKDRKDLLVKLALLPKQRLVLPLELSMLAPEFVLAATQTLPMFSICQAILTNSTELSTAKPQNILSLKS